MSKSNISNTYYIGHIFCNANNAMMKEIADFVMDYEYSLIHIPPMDLFATLRYAISKICANHKRCKPVELQMTTGLYSVNIYACKTGSDSTIINMTLNEVLNEIESV